MQNSRMLLVVSVLFVAALAVTGCAAGRSGPEQPVTGRNEAGKTAETGAAVMQEGQEQAAGAPAAAPEEPVARETAKQRAVNAEQPGAQEQTGDKPVQEPVSVQEKPLVIVSENPVFADTGQLLVELDKELEFFLGALESADEISDEELNF